MGRVLGIALLLAAVLSGTAAAATVRVVSIQDSEPAGDPFSREEEFFRYSVLRFKAGSRERNRLVVQRASRGRIRFRDRGALLQPGRGCRSTGRHAVVCRPRDLRELRIYLYDGAAHRRLRD